MQQRLSKGFISAVIAAAAMIALVFVVSSASSMEQQSDAFLKQQASRELALKTENLLRLLDKATSDGYCYANNRTRYFSQTIASMENGETFKCNRPNAISDTLECTTKINGAKIKRSINFNFSKSITPGAGVCAAGISVVDDISNCQEEPSHITRCDQPPAP